ncbi:hypothetical protein [Nocardioides sp. WS12]|uniref:hypothetical protein n=1 Tax=Nocardioides sp. WS12 TaxID=2486272 RepID=UPI0015FABB47|nr:hypothetical protein [Nocardioides sp. WS12]
MSEEQLNSVRALGSILDGCRDFRHTVPSEPAYLIDLSIPDGQAEPEHLQFRAWITIPVAVPEEVSILGVVQAVNNKLNGRKPLTFVKPDRDAVITNFSIYDVSVSCRREVDGFATSLNELLRPMTVSGSNVQYHFAGTPIEDHLKH